MLNIGALNTTTFTRRLQRVKRIISELIRKNKGSRKDPSFAFKISVVVLTFLIIGSTFSGAGKEKEGGGIKGIERLAVNQADVFSSPMTALIEESPDLLISQGNTIYASAPLFMPKTQVLGAQSLFNEEKKDIISYTVRSGDSIDTIANSFGISRKTIIWANELKGSTVEPGQELVILPVSGVFHIVSSGDTIKSISSKYKANIDEIIEFNELAGQDDVRPGDILIIPGGEVRAVVAVAPARSSSDSSSWLIPPASGRVSQRMHWYNAVDISTSCGNPIYASAGGTVQATGYHSIGGNFVRILHPNGIVTYYGHMSKIVVSTGQTVSQGDHIGNIGNTGHTIGVTGCHVHFEVRGGVNPFVAYPIGHRF